MRFTVRHVTRFNYETPITESVMEARMQPRSDGLQRCLRFSLTPVPAARVMVYQDHDGNVVHHFDIPARHSRLTLTAEALVESIKRDPLPHRLGPRAWDHLDEAVASGEFWEYLAPSTFTHASPRLDDLARELRLERGNDPMVLLRRLMGEIYSRFEYRPQSTRVDSPIDEALETKRGVCQDFAHIFIALTRPLGIPTRYVSGYLFRDVARRDQGTEDATHAWVEALVPEVGWVGFDPANNLLAEENHIRVAIGRDYGDVPPTRGVYKGATVVRNELAVAVRVDAAHAPSSGDLMPFVPWMSREAGAPISNSESETLAQQQLHQQQQQQQQ
jgi:transglutaminase-like putative cysteine protease